MQRDLLVGRPELTHNLAHLESFWQAKTFLGEESVVEAEWNGNRHIGSTDFNHRLSVNNQKNS